jgi:hypothetical protein
MAMPTRAQVAHDFEADQRRYRNLMEALPSLDTLRIDPEIAEAPSLDGLCCAYFEGCERRDPPALLAVALERDRLFVRRWRSECLVTPARLNSAVGEAIARALRQLGQAEEPASELGRRFMAGLRPLGINRGLRTYQRTDWERSLTLMEDRVAEALARCLVQLFDTSPMPCQVQLFDPSPTPCQVEVIYYPLGCAENPRGSRNRVDYAAPHGTANSLRRAA